MMRYIDFRKAGSWSIFFLVGFLPWSVIFSVFFTQVLGIGEVKIFKEVILILISVFFLFDFLSPRDGVRKKIRFDILDVSIVLYVLCLLIVSYINKVSFIGYVYGLRYDVFFLYVFFLFRRALPWWGISFQQLLKIFLISGGLMLFFGILIRYIFGETLLTVFGFSGKVSVWDGAVPPIYHGIHGASVVRFQGVLEGPNQMAFFLLIYIASFWEFMRRKKKYFFLTTCILIILGFLLFQTYSRSAMLGLFVGFCAYLFFFFRNKNKKKTLRIIFLSFLIGVIGCGLVFFFYGSRLQSIMGRQASTSGHFERMYIGIIRFQETPFGSGLASSGPASRSRFAVNDQPVEHPDDPKIQSVLSLLRKKNKDFIYTSETYYIPESWYIQQFIEGGIIGGMLFLLILGLIGIKIYRFHPIFGAFIGVLVMNIFLHSFESMHSSLILFILLAAIASFQDHAT